MKLASKFNGPYRVIQKLGPVTYKLQIPAHAQIHLVFHVSMLKKKVGEGHVVCQDLPLVGADG